MNTTTTYNPPVIVFAGATASGKSALALEVAQKLNGEIISADSRQIYCELTIGSAKPSNDALQQVKHHFINEKHLGEPFSAGDFATEAIARINHIHQQGKRAIIAGGSTLYLEGLLKGFANLPNANEALRARLTDELQTVGSEALYQRLLRLDPEQAKTLDATKTQRLIRSLEIIELTGKSVTELQTLTAPKHNFTFLTFALAVPREILYQRINNRVDEMVADGLVQEVEQLYQQYKDVLRTKKIAALQSVGYQELFDFFEHKTSVDEAVSLIKQHTRNYAKRQITFFSNRLQLPWVDAATIWQELN